VHPAVGSGGVRRLLNFSKVEADRWIKQIPSLGECAFPTLSATVTCLSWKAADTSHTYNREYPVTLAIRYQLLIGQGRSFIYTITHIHQSFYVLRPHTLIKNGKNYQKTSERLSLIQSG